MCNIDGSDMKLIYKEKEGVISNPQFTPDMKELVFVKNAQICKAPYRYYYQSIDGTSMAAPVVCGLALLLPGLVS